MTREIDLTGGDGAEDEDEGRAFSIGPAESVEFMELSAVVLDAESFLAEIDDFHYSVCTPSARAASFTPAKTCELSATIPASELEDVSWIGPAAIGDVHVLFDEVTIDVYTTRHQYTLTFSYVEVDDISTPSGTDAFVLDARGTHGGGSVRERGE